MKRIIVAFAALAGMLGSSPALAQQSRNMSTLPGDNTVRSVPPAPPPSRYDPPPIPPMPKFRPGYKSSKVTVHRSSSQQAKKATKRTTKATRTASTKARHQATKKSVRLASKSSKHEASKARHASSAKRSDRTSAKPEKVFLSKKTIRQCHAMGYAQIMRNEHCRALMKQELAEADHKAAAKKSKTAKNAKSAKSYKSAKVTKSTKRTRHRR